MHFEDTPEEAAFRSEVRTFLQHAAAEYAEAPAIPWSEDELVARVRALQKKRAAAGFAAISWPVEYGGRGASPIQSVILGQEEARYHLPHGAFLGVGLYMAGSTIMRHGTDAQKARFLEATLRADIFWCQLFSEPAAGSDLAGVRTRAVRDGEDWVVDGQKVWTSGATVADYGILLARTDPSVPKHKGLTYFIIDMRLPGITIRPIRQINGRSEFNEVFLEGVRIPDGMRLGAVGEGWKVAMTTLMNERGGVGARASGATVADLIALARTAPDPAGTALDNAATRLRIAELFVREQGLRYLRMRTMTRLSRGEAPGAEGGIAKLVLGDLLQRTGALAMELQGPAALVSDRDHAPDILPFQATFLWSAGMRIAGGVDEVLRNQLAERVLGMPGDTRVDKDVPFNEIPTGI